MGGFPKRCARSLAPAEPLRILWCEEVRRVRRGQRGDIFSAVCNTTPETAGVRKTKRPRLSTWPFAKYGGAAGRIRTHDPLVRSQVLYPTELQPREKARL